MTRPPPFSNVHDAECFDVLHSDAFLAVTAVVVEPVVGCSSAYYTKLDYHDMQAFFERLYVPPPAVCLLGLLDLARPTTGLDERLGNRQSFLVVSLSENHSK